jgi:hypothetical protein
MDKVAPVGGMQWLRFNGFQQAFQFIPLSGKKIMVSSHPLI